MNHRNLRPRSHLLWLAAVLGLIILGSLFIRPPAWATPGATHLRWQTPRQGKAASSQLVASAADAVSSASHLTLQADAPSSDNCITCHTDKKKLKAMAEEPEEVKSEEASGEG